MIEKVNKSHPDKIADRIAGAIVDMAYSIEENPKIEVEVLIGHGVCHIIIETTAYLNRQDIHKIVNRIAGNVMTDITIVPQNKNLANNQSMIVRCGDNGIFRGVPLTDEQKKLSKIVHEIYNICPYDGKYILDGNKLIMCQSNMKAVEAIDFFNAYPELLLNFNPIGYWTGGTNVDTGASNRKNGSDLADSYTGGLHGKDLSKADVSVAIHAFLKAQKSNHPVEICCVIGDTEVDGLPYSTIVAEARTYITALGGFEKLAEWGLW